MMIKIGDKVTVNREIEEPIRKAGEPHPDWGKIYIVKDTDGGLS